MAPAKKTSTTDNINKLILLKKFAHVEDLAHRLAYNKTVKDGDTIQLLDYNGQAQNATIRRIPIQNPSIVATILEIKSDDPMLPNKVEVIWRGTHDKGSAIADLDPISPGYNEYMKNRSIILSEVNNAIGRMSIDGKNVSVGSYGHSLGGSLAQTFATDVMDAMAQNQHDKQPAILNKTFPLAQPVVNSSISIPKIERNNFNSVNHITIGTFNAAGVSKKTALRAKELENYLHNLAFIAKKDQPKISYFAGLNEGDGVQQTGEASILSDSTKSNVYLLKTNLEKTMFYKILTGAISIGSSLLVPKFGPAASNFAKIIKDLSVKAIGTAHAHTAKVFDKTQNLESNVINFELYQNNQLDERPYITQQLNNKSKILQNPTLKVFQATIYYFADKLLNKFRKSPTTKPATPTTTTTPTSIPTRKAGILFEHEQTKTKHQHSTVSTINMEDLKRTFDQLSKSKK